jgi:hypothetical protein
LHQKTCHMSGRNSTAVKRPLCLPTAQRKDTLALVSPSANCWWSATAGPLRCGITLLAAVKSPLAFLCQAIDISLLFILCQLLSEGGIDLTPEMRLLRPFGKCGASFLNPSPPACSVEKHALAEEIEPGAAVHLPLDPANTPALSTCFDDLAFADRRSPSPARAERIATTGSRCAAHLLPHRQAAPAGEPLWTHDPHGHRPRLPAARAT